MKLKKSTLIIAGVIVVLIALIAVFAVLNQERLSGQQADGSLTITAGDTTLKRFSYEELQALPSISVEKLITSSKEADESGVFTGVPLETLLNSCDPAWADTYTEFILNGSDGFVSSVFASDVEKGGNVLVVYAKDGELLQGPDQGGKGPLRIVVVDDPFGNRSAYLLVSIEAK